MIRDHRGREGHTLVQQRLVSETSNWTSWIPSQIKTRQVYTYMICDKNGVHMFGVDMDPWEAEQFAKNNGLEINKHPWFKKPPETPKNCIDIGTI